MAPQKRKHIEDDEADDHIDLESASDPPSINPYAVLEIDKSATQDQIKSAYRRQALKHHPDKAQDKAAAHTKFQEIAFAYAVLSDEKRRKRFDLTGSTDDSIGGDEEFDWASFYREQYEDAVTSEKIAAFEKEYKGSEEEAADVIKSYVKAKGSMAKLYQLVMLSDVVADEERFRTIIDKAIAEGDVEAFPKYTKETVKARETRIKAAKKSASKEAAEADEVAEELEITKKEIKKDDGMADLAALIQKRQKDRSGRAESFFDSLAAKYGPKTKSKRAKEVR